MRDAIARWQRKLALYNGNSPENLQVIAASPRFYPQELVLDKSAAALSFVEAGPDTYRRSSFLDSRMQREPGGKTILCGARELLDYYKSVPAERPPGFIFHVAYCCSTLLARYLELLPGTFVLKEPFLPTQLAELSRLPSIAEGLQLKDVAQLCARLMARTFHPGDRVIVKFNDQCNAVASLLMASGGAPRAVFLGLELRSFLMAGLKTDLRRAWARRRAQLAAHDVRPSPLAQIDPKTLDEAQNCAYLWLANGVLLQRLIRDAGADRILVLDGETISDNPNGAVRATAEWLGLSPDEPALEAAIHDPTAARYSKDPSQSFSREDRRAELASIYARLSEEVEAAMTWADPIAAGLGLNPRSGRMLADQRP